jgi:AmmeMemoRadiSam system protein B
MILPKLRNNLDVMPSLSSERPGLLIRDNFRYSDARLIIPPLLMQGLGFFDGVRSDDDMHAEFSRLTGQADMRKAVQDMIAALTQAGFLDDETYRKLREKKQRDFALAPMREPAHAGSAYPDEVGSLEKVMRRYLEGAATPQPGIRGIAAPHVSPEGGWQSYRAAYHALTADLQDKTFVVLGTSHYGAPNKFGLTRKPFKTPYGKTRIDGKLVNELAACPAAVMEDYAHAIEHSIEFQVLFLQALYGPDVRVLPILCGSYGHSIHNGGVPEDDEGVRGFLGTLGEMAEREKNRLFWVLGIDMAHMGARYRDRFEARAGQNEMGIVAQRDRQRIERINAGDAKGFWQLVQQNRDDLKWCGSSPLYTFLKTMPQIRGTLQRYEQWNIDQRSVVSFAGISFGI